MKLIPLTEMTTADSGTYYIERDVLLNPRFVVRISEGSHKDGICQSARNAYPNFVWVITEGGGSLRVCGTLEELRPLFERGG